MVKRKEEEHEVATRRAALARGDCSYGSPSSTPSPMRLGTSWAR